MERAGGTNRLEEEAVVLLFLRGPCAIASLGGRKMEVWRVMRCGMPMSY